MRYHIVPLAMILVAAACADDDDTTADRVPDGDSSAVIITTSTTTPDPAPTTTGSTISASDSTDPPAAEPSLPPTTSPATDPPAPSPVVGDPAVGSVEVVEVEQPVDLAVRPGDDALYLVEQPGRVIRFADGTDVVVADLTDRIASGGERGLLGVVFSPDGTLAYANYTDARNDTVVAEFPVAADGTFDIGSERVVLTVDQPFSNHNAGDLAFGADGMLYIPLGDGGDGGDPGRRASDPTSFLGSLLRIDPARTADAPYTIPADNPFADGEHRGLSGAPEVWAWGLRNPWKIAFDPVTADLWIADVGQNRYEEINRVEPLDGGPSGRGADFGWSAFEGTNRFNEDVADPGDTTMPVLTYEHGRDGCSISGGAPYRGTAIVGLEPAFVYSDYCSGIVWALDLAGGRNLTLLDGFSDVTAVRAGPDGELYVLERGGTVNLLVPA